MRLDLALLSGGQLQVGAGDEVKDGQFLLGEVLGDVALVLLA